MTKAGEVYFRDGRRFKGKHRKYLMEHAGSRGKVSPRKMWKFVSSISNNELGIISAFQKSKEVSVRMRRLTNRIKKKHSYILVDVAGLHPCIT